MLKAERVQFYASVLLKTLIWRHFQRILLINNRKQTMRTKRVSPKLSDLEIWYEVFPCRSKSTDQISLETYLPDIKVKRYRIYRADRKLQSNFIEITFRHGCSSVSLLHIFRTPFPKNTSSGIPLNFEWYFLVCVQIITKNNLLTVEKSVSAMK